VTEWQVVGVLIAIVGFVAAIVSPIIKLNTSIVKLSTLVDGLGNKLSTMESTNAASHDRIWNKLDEHGDELQDHDKRIIKLEGQKHEG
jgi:hypothetical protein